MPEDKINGLKCVCWTYTVHAEDKIGNSIDLRHIGRFDTPTKASTYLRQNDGTWEFFSNFETCEPNTIAREQLLNMFGNKKINGDLCNMTEKERLEVIKHSYEVLHRLVKDLNERVEDAKEGIATSDQKLIMGGV